MQGEFLSDRIYYCLVRFVCLFVDFIDRVIFLLEMYEMPRMVSKDIIDAISVPWYKFLKLKFP